MYTTYIVRTYKTCKLGGGGNVYNEINRRCLEHFHGIFDDAVFCICLDDTGDSELVQKAVEWIWSCGFKDNVTIKAKPNSPYRDAQTFYDEVVNHLSEFNGMVFFGHNKGNTMSEIDGLKQWIIFSYYACLDRIGEKVANLSDHAVIHTYIPLVEEGYTVFNEHRWLAPGTFFIFNPQKICSHIKINKITIPKLEDRYSAETFFPKLLDITDGKRYSFLTDVMFEHCINTWLVGEPDFDYYWANHVELLGEFLPSERVEEYKHFYETITEGL